MAMRTEVQIKKEEEEEEEDDENQPPPPPLPVQRSEREKNGEGRLGCCPFMVSLCRN